ncbi:hypothetical protein [Yoonia sp.]|uniref:hypothetical protein n=1 Tax=Yoonia sp. TaxID=2212373 RepID=UPI002DFD657E|nr:hypothetical protein [Yoonia sp.]
MKCYRSIILICALFLSPLAVHAQTYDFSISYVGLEDVGGDGTISGFLNFEDGSISTNDISGLNFTSGGVSREITNVNQSTAVLGGGSSGSTLGLLSLEFETGYSGQTWVIDASYSYSQFVENKIRIDAILVGASQGAFSTVTDYTLGGATVDTGSGDVTSGGEPVAVPEINGGNLALISFILGTLSLVLVGSRRRVGSGQSAFA